MPDQLIPQAIKNYLMANYARTIGEKDRNEQE
ncbi:MAG: hypothetical protein ACLRYB_09565 [Segatella copri]